MQKDRIKAIQETIAGFLREQVTSLNGEFHFNVNETLIPNNDDHLYRLYRFGEKNSMYIVLIKLYIKLFTYPSI
jgi:hypothetical protein